MFDVPAGVVRVNNIERKKLTRSVLFILENPRAISPAHGIFHSLCSHITVARMEEDFCLVSLF